MNTAGTLLFLVPILFFSWVARSDDSKLGLIVEPGLTFELGSAAVDYPSPLSSSTGSANGFGLAARLGFHVSEVIFIALDARYSMPQYKDSTASYDAKAVATNWGPVAGVQMPIIGLRAWASILLGGELNPEKSGSLDVAFKKASGYRIGAGFRIFPLSFNLEYQQVNYAETTLEQIGPFSTNTSLNNVALDNRSWIASVSFPLEL